MRPTIRRAAIAALLIASLAPGLVQARAFNGPLEVVSVEMGRDGGFFVTVWSLLADVLAGRVPGSSLASSPIVAKDTTTTTTATTPPTDNGGHLDPNG